MALASAYKSRDGMSASAHMFSHRYTTSCSSIKGAPRSPLTAPHTLKAHFYCPSHPLVMSRCTGKHLAFSP